MNLSQVIMLRATNWEENKRFSFNLKYTPTEPLMLKFGGKPTGAYYPTGIERADNIAKCAAQY